MIKDPIAPQISLYINFCEPLKMHLISKCSDYKPTF